MNICASSIGESNLYKKYRNTWKYSDDDDKLQSHYVLKADSQLIYRRRIYYEERQCLHKLEKLREVYSTTAFLSKLHQPHKSKVAVILLRKRPSCILEAHRSDIYADCLRYSMFVRAFLNLYLKIATAISYHIPTYS